VQSVTRVPQVMENIAALRELRFSDKGVADTGPDASLELASLEPDGNAALEAWRKVRS